jgi:hypothetical protein
MGGEEIVGAGAQRRWMEESNHRDVTARTAV